MSESESVNAPTGESPVDLSGTPVETAEPPAGNFPVRRRRVRNTAVGVLVVISAILVLASTIGLWSYRQVYNTDVFAGHVDSVLAEPTVQANLSNYLTDQIMGAINPEQRARDALPAQADALDSAHGVGHSQLCEPVRTKSGVKRAVRHAGGQVGSPRSQLGHQASQRREGRRSEPERRRGGLQHPADDRSGSSADQRAGISRRPYDSGPDGARRAALGPTPGAERQTRRNPSSRLRPVGRVQVRQSQIRSGCRAPGPAWTRVADRRHPRPDRDHPAAVPPPVADPGRARHRDRHRHAGRLCGHQGRDPGCAQTGGHSRRGDRLCGR